MMKHLLITMLIITAVTTSYSQTTYAYQTFDDTRIVNGQSVETNMEGELTFIIAHRFGPTNDDPNYLWGLDFAQMRMGLQYGINNNLMIGLGRNSTDKTIDGFVKYKALAQSTGDKNMPVTLSLLGYAAVKPQLFVNNVEYTFNQKLSYVAQVLIGRKFSDRISAQITPTYLHRNLVGDDEYNEILSIGTAVQWSVLKNWSLTAEYYHTPNSMLPDENSTLNYTQSLCLGIQIDTKGHIFTFNVGNSNGMTERIFLAESAGSWQDRNLYFGFNITRDFKVKGRRVR